MTTKLTQAEADRLIAMLKKIALWHIDFPTSKGGLSFDAEGTIDDDKFVITIDRKGINHNACSYQGRIKKNNEILLRLDVNPNNVHFDPITGEKIIGTHLHIFTEGIDNVGHAIPFDIENKDLCELCYTFFDQFHIIDRPTIAQPQRM